MCLDHHRRVHTIDDSNYVVNSTMAQPHREAMAARVGPSYLLDNFKDLQGPSSPSGVCSRVSPSSHGWMSLSLGIGGIYARRKNYLEGEVKKARKGDGPAGLGQFFFSSRLQLHLQVFLHLLKSCLRVMWRLDVLFSEIWIGLDVFLVSKYPGLIFN